MMPLFSPLDTYVKAYLVGGSKVIQKKKTHVVKGSFCPFFRRTIKYSACNIHGRAIKVNIPTIYIYRLSGLSPVTYFSWPCSVLFRSFCGRGTARSTRSSPWGRPSSNLTALTWCISPLIGTNCFHREPPTSVPTNLSISGELRNSWRNPAVSTGQGRPALIVGEMGDPHLWPPLGSVCFDLRRVIALAASAAVATPGACFRLSQNVWSTLIWSFDFPI